MSSKCAPYKNAEISCFTFDELLEIAKAYNKYQDICLKNKCVKTTQIKNPQNYSKKQLYKILSERLSTLCDTDSCWLDLPFLNSIKNQDIYKNLLYFTFKPKFIGKRTKWLSTSDINAVMYQYVHKKSKILYLGALPSNFYEITNINLKDFKKYNKVLIVLNTDPNHKQGQHWLAMCIDNNLKLIEYFDSLGDPPNKMIKRFLKNLIKEYPNYKLEINDIQHQYGKSECGVYAIYFLIQKLKGKLLKSINKKIIKDDFINKFRDKIFRMYMK